MARYMAFSDRLRQFVKRSGMSQHAVAQAIGVNPSNFYKFMQGDAGLLMDRVDDLCKFLKLDLKERGT